MLQKYIISKVINTFTLFEKYTETLYLNKGHL